MLRKIFLPSLRLEGANQTSRKAQYERRFKLWGFQKNKKGDIWEAIAHKVAKRKRGNKDSGVILSEDVIPKKKLMKEISRHGYDATFPHQFQGGHYPSNPSSSRYRMLILW